jgi:light-regulated signal transduction histidine kinase (bacteriophytochrome)
VKNPLAVILGSARVAIRDRGGDNPRVFQRIESAALQAASLVDQLSDLHSLDGSGIALECRPADLRRTVEAAKDQMEAIARGHALRYTGSGESVMVDYDERRIQRVLQNLISNAIKYSPDGGDIDINIRADGSDAAISIRDHGIGIPEADAWSCLRTGVSRKHRRCDSGHRSWPLHQLGNRQTTRWLDCMPRGRGPRDRVRGPPSVSSPPRRGGTRSGASRSPRRACRCRSSDRSP